MIEREKILLSLIENAPDRKMSRLQLVKLCFLIAQTWQKPTSTSVYKFLPYRFGPFSFTLYHELDDLIKIGAIERIGDDVRRPGGMEPVDLNPYSRQMVQYASNRYGKMSIDALLDFVYGKYPWYTCKSDKVEKRGATVPVVPPKVYTSGYQGCQLDGFLNRLLKNGICRIIDVRCNPVSRQYGFHKQTLAKSANNVGIDYEHVADLGIPSALRANLESPDDYISLFARYRNEILPLHTDSINKVCNMIREKPSALVCQEADPKQCHRTVLAQVVSKHVHLKIEDIAGE